MFSNRYIFIYSTVMVIIVATVLASAANLLKPFQEKNIEVEKIRNILATSYIETDFASAKSQYEKYVTNEIVVNSKGDILDGENAFEINLAIENKKENIQDRKLPVFEITLDNGDKNYVVPLRGKGLWGPIWGYVSFAEDLNTIIGTNFDHKGETPGLGSEINTKWFQENFVHKKIFDQEGKFVSVRVIKGGAPDDDEHGVDAISGGTITSVGLDEMLKDGLFLYVEYFNKLKIQ